MKASSVIELIFGIIMICLFLLPWLVFKDIKTADWIALALGVLNLIFFAVSLKNNKSVEE